MRKVLLLSHNHPSVRPGGAEAYTLELYHALRQSGMFEPTLLAKAGPPMSSQRPPHPGTLLGSINNDPHQYLFYTDGAEFDYFYGVSRNKDVSTWFFHEFLSACQPDIIHFQHSLFLGYDFIRQARNTFPDTPIVYTLHEYLPICHNQGQMLRTTNQELCSEESPRRCHECFPGVSPQSFFMRKKFIQSHFAAVDLFLAPSQFLLERYVEWGLPRDKMRYEPNGRLLGARLVQEARSARSQFGFFGQFSRFKGVTVLLKAMAILAKENRANNHRGAYDKEPAANIRLILHGANLEIQDGTFQNEVQSLLTATQDNVRLFGRYRHDELPRLMTNVDWVVVPSIWWENSPLVIQEAFAHGRPVICSDIGGMAEKVVNGIDGLHFRTGDPDSLAQTIRYAANTSGLWDKLHAGLPDVYRMEEHVASLSTIYQSLLER